MIDIRPVAVAELAAVEQLYAQVFGGSLNRRLVVGLGHNGGRLLGAFTDGALVGYGLSFPATEDGRRYHYSQTVGVAPHARGRGAGRAVKKAQREAALADGADQLRWVFDPANTGNGRFNTSVLGGRITRFYRDFYGDGSDRVRVDWELRQVLPPVSAPTSVRPEDVGGALERGLVGVACADGCYRFGTP